ncbi:hypothetical protein VL04_18350 [Chromobacterium violaceum]|uniref:hypothetical protein n=1 Tax=Chromobacterium violaceum TaxID=536 RepID=UPI000654A2FF|nr:hypothetical protein [Chromobacterium violaceum]KMN48634.1 hypothetical protein VK93_14020 [Chromobacterium violaceum]KMN87729.1 hypothetical protein VL02_00015 [Chromobacterium violaceum]KMN88838.1 hypothetical protein VL04_18350 [Chromobacterium violaceum]KMO05332.1 hypothetical protein VL16_02000 [Chromobacterium violaceum]
MHLNPILQALRSTLLRQAEEAFSEKPDLAGVVHGRRRITQGARGRRTTLFPSRMNDVTLALESQLETSFCLQLERNLEVTGYRCQALELELGKGRRYFPDFLIRMHGGRWLVREIKPSRLHLTDEVRERLGEIEKLLALCGFDFAVVDVTDLPGQVQLENLYSLYHRSIIKQWSRQECDLAMALIAQQPGPQTLGSWHTHLAEAGLSPLLVDHLLFHGQLSADLDRPLRLDMPVGMPI